MPQIINHQSSIFNLKYDLSGSQLKALKSLYASMDQKFQDAAEHYGFRCNGCRASCCLTLFYHYTFLEYCYIRKGYAVLANDVRLEVRRRASEVCQKMSMPDKTNAMPVRLMCPLNFNGLCILYDYRPMICRLHGIPHELQKPGQKPIYGPGCETFDRRCGRREYFKFDRTPFYQDLATLEQGARQALGFNGKIRMTVAEMILDFHS